MAPEDLTNRFMYHAPTVAKRGVHEEVRFLCLELAEALNGMLPEGREKSLAITHVEEAMFWSNAAVARSPESPS